MVSTPLFNTVKNYKLYLHFFDCVKLIKIDKAAAAYVARMQWRGIRRNHKHNAAASHFHAASIFGLM